ncbi:hypothetical protein FA95DRAFT_1611403 [Auriscalpium vulgare]|uniref:Uncharacterized protein n=1 Tax=Auriscalpium vulgare TaxID=40419 RepID=A0ACB8RAX3_9AGAM|nr:hypothetical protein FA95DRAFT_1611403 [Auriscalpium vulgare]
MGQSLPPDLLLRIIQLVSPDVQLIVRTLSKQFCALATPVAFRTLRCLNTPRSATGFLNILDNEDLNLYVQSVVYYDGEGARYWYWYGNGGDMDDDDIDFERDVENDISDAELDGLSDAEQDELFVTLTEAFSRLHTLPSLNAISVTFPLGKYSFKPDFTNGILVSAYEGRVASVPELRIQLGILARLEVFATARYFASQGRAPLRSLTIRNLNPYFTRQLSFSPFRRLFEGLTNLRLCIFTSIDAADGVRIPLLTYFCNDILPSLLRASKSTLRSLTLQVDQVLGYHAGLFLGDLHYPRLQYLSLFNILFSDATGTETFIISHARTLRSLVITDCKIDAATKSSLSWSRVYARLGEALTELVHMGDTASQEYGHLDPRHGWLSAEDIPVMEQDEAALAMKGDEAALVTKEDEAALAVLLDLVARRNANTHAC